MTRPCLVTVCLCEPSSSSHCSPERKCRGHAGRQWIGEPGYRQRNPTLQYDLGYNKRLHGRTTTEGIRQPRDAANELDLGITHSDAIYASAWCRRRTPSRSV